MKKVMTIIIKRSKQFLSTTVIIKSVDFHLLLNWMAFLSHTEPIFLSGFLTLVALFTKPFKFKTPLFLDC